MAKCSPLNETAPKLKPDKHVPGSIHQPFPATTHGDSTNEEDEQTIVAVERAVMLCGGVTRNHIISTLHMWESILLNAAIFFTGTIDENDELSEE